MKKRLIYYFRYHHYNTNPLKESHSTYITCLSYLEEIGGFNVDGLSVDKAWKKIYVTISNLTNKQVVKLNKLRSK